MTDEPTTSPPVPRRADARRNQRSLLDAAAAVFVRSGVDAPVRQIAAEAGVGMGTIYRHFPTRADLVVAVFRHQVDACVAAATTLLDSDAAPFAALEQWTDAFVDFLATKHGLAAALHDDRAGSEALHAQFAERLVPACASLMEAARRSGELCAEIDSYDLLRGIGNLCISTGTDDRFDPRPVVRLLVAGLRTPPA